MLWGQTSRELNSQECSILARKPPDTGKANKMKREGLCFPSRTQLPQRPSHITDLQTNYFEPDILKNFPLQLSEHRESQNRELGSRLR